jgi:uncharacterized membrane protein YjjB (DUF3815 family)
MHIVAFILALAAVVAFAVEWYAVTPRRPLPLGLALLTIAWMVQLIFATSHPVSVH